MKKPLVKGFQVHIWTRIAISVAILVYLSVIGLTFFFPELDFRLILLIVGLVFLGMPHGAMDIYLASQTIKTKKQIFLFISIYLALGLLILSLWMLSPTFSFLFFILYSMFHFADSDLQKNILESKLSLLEFMARLSLPFGLPLIFYKAETLQLVNYIHPQIVFQPYVVVFQAFGYLGLALVTTFTFISFYNLIADFENQDLTFLEPLVLCVLFSQITPLYALGIYFCFIHAIKHIINILRKVEIRSMKSILPYWLLPLLGLPVLFFIYTWSDTYSAELFQAHIFQYIIVTLSAVAFPHAMLIRFCKSRNIIN